MTDDATATLHPVAGGLHRLDLEGAFTHPHWLPFLCGGLAAAGISVVEGHTVRESPMRWSGQLVLDATRARTPIDLLDPVVLANTRPAVRDATAPVLTSYELVRLPDKQLQLAFTAPDALGFLGRLLSRISLLALLPSKLEIATVRGMISDTVVLGGIGSSAPSDEVVASLRELLTGMVAPVRSTF